MASAASDWSPVEKILVGICGRGSDSQLSYSALITPELTVNQVECNRDY